MSRKETNYKQYVCLVDHYRRPGRKRNTAGRYRVGAKNEKEARKLVQQAIGFGGVIVYYEDKAVLPVFKVKYGQVMREESWFDEDCKRYNSRLVPARHATACRKEKICQTNS